MKLSTKRHLPSIANIESFLSVARLHSVTAASEELFLTQGAVSKQILELEKHVGKSLFTRSAQGLQPTAAGRALFERLSPLVADLEDAFGEIRAEARSVLNISVSPSFGMEIIAPNLSDFMEANPWLMVNLYTRLGEVDLDREGLDAAVVSGESRSNAYASERLFTPALFPYISPALLAPGAEGELSALTRSKLIGLVNMSSAWPDYFDMLGLPFSPSMVVANHSLLSTSAQAVISGYGIALLPEYLAGQHVRTGLMVRIGNTAYRGSNPYYLMARKQCVSGEPYQRFRDWLLGLLRNMGQLT
ncbi:MULTISPECIES: LysR substrate-binding domain-containing protein [unclassified Variovorax]|uniref:LysR family transcriptional regulator n=1 Tax=unclassified Variovorax TaxID=663243 RepID=UPI00076BC610|nr:MULTISPECIES: LysR substrate-binding domain-containing protein [unclassified Variovorax]KWT97961.1 transcriptional regulator, LysR family [Variovorax sp. WDL1]PNG59200.1 Glycine cleavage system transcriptional activator [Variovorax sp. B4]PNG61009.1 Glycine cleavage system transcriptional activator [Variovorax sp. B2]VTV13052.1 Gcv operon activator [Variovorax sp. WDL1]